MFTILCYTYIIKQHSACHKTNPTNTRSYFDIFHVINSVSAVTVLLAILIIIDTNIDADIVTISFNLHCFRMLTNVWNTDIKMIFECLSYPIGATISISIIEFF